MHTPEEDRRDALESSPVDPPERRKSTQDKRQFLEALRAEIALYDRQLSLPLDTPGKPDRR
ncbi:hypothetical protein PSm6_55530 [Pseudomonas solani]|uniref:Transcriptional regulator n=1 Tax=Pseudomonas solani TaxID=2731552 RepID=A0ABM7LHT8_9PSED|nr:hypothetical protein [Pseudomonas solani]BCD89146.1 hypothetical protein PSm6_55530 [Pseudomonas solani]